jgi:hypothetical protein
MTQYVVYGFSGLADAEDRKIFSRAMTCNVGREGRFPVLFKPACWWFVLPATKTSKANVIQGQTKGHAE